MPKQDQSGEIDKQCSITKAWRICASGGPKSRNRAVSAVAKGLAVTMLALIKHPEREYKALSDDKRGGWKTAFGPIPEPSERILIKRT